MQELSQRKVIENFSMFGENKIDFKDIFYSLLAEKWLILIITSIFLFFGIYSAMNKTPIYQASVLLQVDKKGNNNYGLLGNSSKLGVVDNGGNLSDIQISLIKSRFTLIPVIEALGLDISTQPRYYPYFGAWYAREHNKTLHPPVFGKTQYAWGGERLNVAQFTVPIQNKELSYKLVAGKNQTYDIYTPDNRLLLHGKVGLLIKKKDQEGEFSIFVKTLIANPGTEFFVTKHFAVTIAEQIAPQIKISDLGELNQLNKTGVLQMSLRGGNPLALIQLLNAIAEIAVENDTNRKIYEIRQTLNFLNKQLPVARGGLKEAEEELNAYRMKSGTIDLNIKSRLLLNQLSIVQKKIVNVNLNRIMLLQKLTPLHPAVIGLQEEKIALEKELLSLEKEMQLIPATDQIALNLMREVKVKSQLYLLMLNKIQELQVTKAGTVSDIRILSLASAPLTMVPLGRFFTILASLMGGLILACLFVLGKKWFNRYVEDPNWVEQNFGIPNFAIVPYSNTQNERMRLHKNKHSSDLAVLAKIQPKDLSIEALRSLRTSLQFALMGAKNNIISIMGISPGIGKSFVSVNFSHVLADSGKRILLIDGDIRKGYLHEYFNAKRHPGLCEVITGTIPITDAIQKTYHANLDFLSSGRFPPNPSELLMSEQFKDILTTVSSQYDLVLIDTAPILAVTDGAIIGNHGGVNFLLVGAGKHPADEINVAIKRLQSNSVKIHGTIFNNTHAKKSGTQRKFNYQYQYG